MGHKNVFKYVDFVASFSFRGDQEADKQFKVYINSHGLVDHLPLIETCHFQSEKGRPEIEEKSPVMACKHSIQNIRTVSS